MASCINSTTFVSHVLRLALVFQCVVFIDVAHAASCNTDQNPTCAGVPAFEALCCSYPSVCYWQNKYATPGCCAAGQVCLTSEGTTIVPNQVISSLSLYTTVTSTYPATTTVAPVASTTLVAVSTAPVASTVVQTSAQVITLSSPNAVVVTVTQSTVNNAITTANAVIATGSDARALRPWLALVVFLVSLSAAYLNV